MKNIGYTINFEYTGDAQTYVVPDGVSIISVATYGASGGSDGGSLTPGGAGGYSSKTLLVTPGQILYVYVGEGGFTTLSGNVNTGGWNGGGSGGYGSNGFGSGPGTAPGGGGATDIRTTLDDLTTRLVVASGGGGTGCSQTGTVSIGGFGGNEYSASGSSGNGYGGKGGNSSSGGSGGGGATQTLGGTKGAPSVDTGCTSGTLGQGGIGGSVSSGNLSVNGGGGGGGGIYGGGGGTSRNDVTNGSTSAGGGGGSSTRSSVISGTVNNNPGIIGQNGSNGKASISVSGLTTTPVSSISLNQLNTIYSGTSELATVSSILPTNASNLKIDWSSSNTNIATVDSSGLVTGTGVGTCNIIATSNDGYGVSSFTPLTVLSNPPVLQVIANPIFTYEEIILITGVISDHENENVSYRLLIDDIVIKDWTSFMISPFQLNDSIQSTSLKLGYSNLVIQAKNTYGDITSSSPIKLKRKSYRTAYIDSNNPGINYTNVSDIINNTCIDLLDVDFDQLNGYATNNTLSIIVQSGTIGKIKIGLITSICDLSTVTYSTKPSLSLDYLSFTLTNGLNNLDITSLINKLYHTINYGIYISYDTITNIVLDPLGTSLILEYIPTHLLQPEFVYGNLCDLKWDPLIYNTSLSIKHMELFRDTNSDFSTETCIFQAFDNTVTSYKDIDISTGIYYYRLKVFDSIDPNLVILNTVRVPVPDLGYRNVLTDPINIVYTLEFPDGFAITVINTATNFYTTSDKIHIKSLNMGLLIGGRTQSIFGFSITNQYLSSSYEVTLRGMTTDGILAEEHSTYGLLYDSPNLDYRSKIEISLTGDTNFIPIYPVIFNLTAGQVQNVYIRITPTIQNTVGTKQVQIKLSGRLI